MQTWLESFMTKFHFCKMILATVSESFFSVFALNMQILSRRVSHGIGDECENFPFKLSSGLVTNFQLLVS